MNDPTGRSGPVRPGAVRSPRSLVGGAALVALAVLALYLVRDLPQGTLRAMGPAMLPRWLAVGVAATGLALVAAGFLEAGEALEGWSVRGPAVVVLAIVAFAVTIRPFAIGAATTPGLGLLVAGPLAIFISGYATKEARPRELTILSLALTALCMELFGDLLNLPIPLFPQALTGLFPPDWSQKAILRAASLAMAVAAALILLATGPGARRLDGGDRAGESLMGDLAANLSLGFGVALGLTNLGLAFLGCLVGTLIGVLPGVGPIATIAMLLPITFGLDPVGALIMLAGIYYGAQYGGSTTAILVNIPGEATSVVTTLDGHQMARQGRAGVALGIAAIGSFFAGTVATLVIAALGAPLTRLALLFGPTEYFSLMVMGLVFAVVLARGSILKAVAMILLGVLLSTIGTDLETGQERMTLGLAFLSDGLDFAVLAMGVFGIAEILRNLDETETRDVVHRAIGRLLPSRDDFRQAAWPIVRGTAIGAALGILPGNGAVLGPFASYTVEKKLAKDPRRFGRGAIEGVAGPESANNAGAQTSFIPLLTLGIPPNAVMALMVGAMTIHGIVPGPQVMTKNPNLFWGMIASMWIGNLMLLVINLPLIGVWVRLLKVPYRLMFPAIVMFCCIGIYSINSLPTDVIMIGAFGIVGYALIKLGFEPAPLLLGFVLGKLMEEYMRRALILSRGDLATFVDRPVSAGLLAVAAILLALALLPTIRKSRDEVFVE